MCAKPVLMNTSKLTNTAEIRMKLPVVFSRDRRENLFRLVVMNPPKKIPRLRKNS